MAASELLSLFLCGDVMTGRGIDQILPHPGSPDLFESYVRSALGYVELAERVNGPIGRPVGFSYIWGDALEALERLRPEARVVNLETAVTAHDEPWPGKGVHYRMHPANVPCLTAFKIDCCVLANNHVMDFGVDGLADTLAALSDARIQTAGAGLDRVRAAAPAIIEPSGGKRVLVFAFGAESSGIPAAWEAMSRHPGVNLLRDLSARRVAEVARCIGAHRRPGDVVVVSLHWGANWGYEIDREERDFAHGLVDVAGAHIVHGHSSHHVKGIEVYRGKLILYGCGDFLTDYEGIGGYEAYRGELGLMYLPTLDAATGGLVGLAMIPTHVKRFRSHRASPADADWLRQTLSREGQELGTAVEARSDGTLRLSWT